MKKQINEAKRMQQLAGLIIESQLTEDQSFFNDFKNFIDNYLKGSDQDVDVSDTNSFDELKQKIDDYWGWEDEQTMNMLEKFIKDYFDTNQIIYMFENYIKNNIQ
jgi:hypothetical protein